MESTFFFFCLYSYFLINLYTSNCTSSNTFHSNIIFLSWQTTNHSFFTWKFRSIVIQTALPIGEYAAVTLLLFFGLKSIKDAWDLPSNVVQSGDKSSPELDEFVEAEELVKEKVILACIQRGFSPWLIALPIVLADRILSIYSNIWYLQCTFFSFRCQKGSLVHLKLSGSHSALYSLQ